MDFRKSFLALLIFMFVASVATAVPVRIDSVDIDGITLTASATNPISIERGNELEIAVRLVGTDSVKNVELEAFVSGFEYNDVERVSDTTGLFDVLANVTYVKRLSIPLPDSIDRDNYKLRIMVTDRNNGELVQNYNLRIDVPRHLVGVKDVLLTPENEIVAGGALLAAVRIENLGLKDEDSVKVRVAVPALGISATKYVNSLRANAESESEDVYLRLPDCASPHVYDVVATVFYSDGHRTAVGKSPITILANELCDEFGVASAVLPPSKLLISVGSNVESVEVGGSAVFPIIVSNNGRTSRSFTVLPVANDWSVLKVSPTSTAIVKPGKSETFYVFASPYDDVSPGSRAVNAVISSSGETLETVSLTANVVRPAGSGFGLKRLLEVGLIVLLILLIAVGLIVGFILLRRDDEGDDFEPAEKSVPYY